MDIMQIVQLGALGFLGFVLLWKVIPDINANHFGMFKLLIESCREDKDAIRKQLTKDAAADREAAAEWRRRDSDRFNRLMTEMARLRKGLHKDDSDDDSAMQRQ